MFEVEVKVEAAHDPVRSRLDDLGAERVGGVRQEDTYYDAPNRDFAATDEALRIRRETTEDGDTVALVTYKGPLVEAESKTREEVETAVTDGDAMATILEAVEFDPAATVRKERERFDYDGYVVSLDAVEGLGEFVEVETEVESDVEAAREGACGVLQTHGLEPENQVRTSYLGLLLEAYESARDNSE